MGQFQIIDNETVTEPVTLAEVKAYSHIDADYSADDDTLTFLITTARIRLEQYTNIGLAKRDVTVQWGGGLLNLPLSPNGDIVSVKDSEGVDVETDKYTVTKFQNKNIWINSLSGVNIEWFYGNGNDYVSPWQWNANECNSIYTVVYSTGYETLPLALKQALLAEVDHLLKLRGMPITDAIGKNTMLLAKGYSRNLIL